MTRTGEHLTDQVFYRKDGSNFPVEYVKTPILEKDKLVGAVVIFKDITERKRTEDALARKAAELARSNAELEQFAYVASHDLQEPLRKIQAFGDRLKSKCDAVQLQEGRDYLERMQNAAARMQTLINDLLTFSRVISTTQPFVPVDLGVVTKEVLTDLEVRIEQTKAKVEVGALPTIEADPLQMRQLLQNLIGNALKFQPPNAQPVVKINGQIINRGFGSGGQPAPADQLCELTIQDNGIGFEEKYTEKIFAVFQRLHGRNEYEGTGVGLAVCRRITDRHGGTISAVSKLGEGATFVVTLPVKHSKGENAA
jgi:light-regulated signal transduction histidine kinase (bacteriophytochrome)